MTFLKKDPPEKQQDPYWVMVKEAPTIKTLDLAVKVNNLFLELLLVLVLHNTVLRDENGKIMNVQPPGFVSQQ